MKLQQVHELPRALVAPSVTGEEGRILAVYIGLSPDEPSKVPDTVPCAFPLPPSPWSLLSLLPPLLLSLLLFLHLPPHPTPPPLLPSSRFKYLHLVFI